LQSVAVRCSVLQWKERVIDIYIRDKCMYVYCVLQCVAVCCSVLQCVAVCCSGKRQ